MSNHLGRVVRFGILIFAATLWGCEGSDGPQGPAGPPGPQGPTGPTGSSPGSAVPIDSVNGGAGERINVAVSSVTIESPPVVSFTLTNSLTQGLNGLPPGDIRFTIAALSPGANGGSSEWQSYITRDSGDIENAQANTETGTAGTLVDNGDGTYTYTFSQDLDDYPAGPTYDPMKQHRLGIEIRGQAPNASNGIFNFVPAGTDPGFSREIVANAGCFACHDRLEFHGGARTDIQYCVTCHNPSSIDGDTVDEPWGGTVNMVEMIHKIHFGVNLANGYFIVGYGNTLHDYSNVVFPQDVRNCTTCHTESDENTPDASNWRLVANRVSCGSCHDDIDWAAGGHPGGIAFTDDTQCLNCHGPDGTVENQDGKLVHTDIMHELPAQIAAENFEYEVVSVTNAEPGQAPIATIRVLNPTDGTYYDINDPMGPFQTGGSRLRMDISWTTEALGNIDPNGDLGRPTDSGPPFPPIVIDFQSGAANDGNNAFTKAADTAIPTGFEGSGIAALEGRAAVDIDGELDEVPVNTDVYTFAITDTEAEERRSIVDIDKCNDCHQNLALHGDNRSGNTEVCSTCHNPNATDVNRRVAASECVNELGPDEETIDFKRMVHRIHAGNIGVCGYRNSAHDYTGVVYPGHLNNCEGCHLEDTYYPVDASVVLATTINTGGNRAILTDDLAITPNTSVCSSCHTSNTAKLHMEQNGGSFEAMKMNDGTTVGGATETCSLCHGPGRSSDVRNIHGVDGFEFN